MIARVVALVVLLSGAQACDQAPLVPTGAQGQDRPPTSGVAGPPAAPAPPSSSARVTAVGDIGTGPQSVQTLQAMGRAGPTVHVALGDLSYAGPGSEPRWCRLVRSSVGEAPFQIVSGNHEDDNGGDGHIAAFANCLPDRMGSVGRYGREYYFDLDRLARVILISPDLTIDGERYDYRPGSGHLRWLEAAVDDARRAGIRWVVVGMHKNCISVGRYDCAVGQPLFSLLVQRGVDLVLTGHDHTYQRSKQLATTDGGCPRVRVGSYQRQCVVDDGGDGRYQRGKGTVFVITGAASERLYELDDDDPEAGYFAAVMGRNRGPRAGFLQLDVSQERLAGAFVGTSPGTFADEFEVVDAPG